MRAPTRTSASQRAQARQRRAERREEKLSRAQIKAMEVRAAETVAVQSGAGVVTVAPEIAVAPQRTVTRRPMARPAVLTREQEYQYIRSDMRRLIITASSLLLLMVLLLLLIE